METGIELVVRVLVGGAEIHPSVGAPPATCCCQSLGSQISALTISSRGPGWPASWCRRVPPAGVGQPEGNLGADLWVAGALHGGFRAKACQVAAKDDVGDAAAY